MFEWIEKDNFKNLYDENDKKWTQWLKWLKMTKITKKDLNDDLND